VHFEVWDIASGKRLQTLPLQKKGFDQLDASFSPDGKRLLGHGFRFTDAVSIESTSTIWDTATGQRVCDLEMAPASYLWTPVFTHDGQHGVSSLQSSVNDTQNDITLWDSGTGKQERSFRGPPGDSYTDLLSRDGKLLFHTAFQDDGDEAGSTLHVFDLTTGKLLRSQLLGFAPLMSQSLSPDSRTLAFVSGTLPGQEREFSIGLLEFNAEKPAASPRQTDEVPSAYFMTTIFTPDGKQLLGLNLKGKNGNRNEIVRWDAASGKHVATVPLSDTQLRWITACTFSSDARLVALPTAHKTAQVYRTDTGELVREIKIGGD
jgi:WD40 repeat protein